MRPNPARQLRPVRPPWHLVLAFGLGCCFSPLVAPAEQESPAAPPERDLTFFVLSDVHVGEERLQADPPITPETARARIAQSLEVMRSLPGRSYPPWPGAPDFKPGAIGVPRALLVLGDLTDGHKELERQRTQWADFEALFPAAGVRFADQLIPVLAIAGNHDGDIDGPQRRGLALRNRTFQQAGAFSALATNAAHFALNWQGVHLVAVSLCPADSTDRETPFKYGQPGPGSWNDPEGAFTFLRDYLTRNVRDSGEPVLLFQHYGFDGFSVNDWNWWTARQRRALYELLAPYNVVAIFHGHNHHAAHYQWPDATLHAADLPVYFGDAVPSAFRQYDVLSCGNICWVIRIRGGQLYAVHFKGPGWPADPRDYFSKSLTPQKP